MEKKTVFISYSHKDEVWKNRLVTHLKVLLHDNEIEIWDDRRIDTGATWYDEIDQALQRAQVAVCIVTDHYLASDFIRKEEIRHILQKRDKEGISLLPFLVSPCGWPKVRWLKDLQIFPRDAKPLKKFSKLEQDELLAMFVDEVERGLSGTSPQLAGSGEPHLFRFANKDSDVEVVVDFSGDSLPQSSTEPTSSKEAWVPLPDESIDIDRLPRTGSEIFGRDGKLSLLDEVWESNEKNVLAFVAWGGVGKSALVNKWIEAMAADNYRGAKRVFAWSFYSQGTGERVTSADTFIGFALRWFGDKETADSTMSSWDKGTRLAELVQEERTLLLLDGMEPLQSGWDHDRGRIIDPGLAALVKHLAAKNQGLCVITTREKVAGLEAYAEWFEHMDLEQISDEAGRALLRVGGIRGTDAELQKVTRDFGNHALAVKLLGSYLRDAQGRHADAASSIPDLPEIPDEKGRHPRRVMEAYAKRFGESPEVDVLSLMGLFDRPAKAEEIDALKGDEPIPGLTEHIHGLSEQDWRRVLENLRAKALIAHESHHNPGSLDAHPLVREHFAEKVQRTSTKAWKEANNRLYEYYKALPEKEYPDTIEQMAPLYQAVTYGCAAGHYNDVLIDLLQKRIQRGEEFFNSYKLGAFSSELAALSCFYENPPPWKAPVAELGEVERAYVNRQVGYCLRTLGRACEAALPLDNALKFYLSKNDSLNIGWTAGIICHLHHLTSDLPSATEYAQLAVKHANTIEEKTYRLSTLGLMFTKSGDILEARQRFAQAVSYLERIKGSFFHPARLLILDFQYGDLLISEDKIEEAKKIITLVLRKLGGSREPIALAQSKLAHAYIGLQGLHKSTAQTLPSNLVNETYIHLNSAIDELRRSGYLDCLPYGLLARAEFNRMTEDFTHAQRDLDETFEIAVRCGLRLFECDAHLESCRLLLAMLESNRSIDPNNIPPDSPFALYLKPSLRGILPEPHPTEAISSVHTVDSRREQAGMTPARDRFDSDAGKRSHVDGPYLSAARQHLNKAESMVNEMGYHRRDPELLLERAHLLILQGDVNNAKTELDKAEAGINEMGCHRWDIDLKRLRAVL